MALGFINTYPNHPATSPPPPQTPPPPSGMPAAVCLKEALCARRKTHSCAAEPSSYVCIVKHTHTSRTSLTSAAAGAWTCVVVPLWDYNRITIIYVTSWNTSHHHKQYTYIYIERERERGNARGGCWCAVGWNWHEDGAGRRCMCLYSIVEYE